jgi:hypothetical protein
MDYVAVMNKTMKKSSYFMIFKLKFVLVAAILLFDRSITISLYSCLSHRWSWHAASKHICFVAVRELATHCGFHSPPPSEIYCDKFSPDVTVQDE